ncbi:MAG: sigma 54-interacting transcriptional regulator [Thermodesulfobacteriota bacterium]
MLKHGNRGVNRPRPGDQGEALHEAAVRCEALLRAFDGLVYICSHRREIEFVNDNLLASRNGVVLGELCHRAVHDLPSPCPWCAHDRVQAGETVRLEIDAPVDGRRYSVVCTPIHHRDGSISTMTVLWDISHPYEAVRQLEQTREELGRVVQERATLSQSNHVLKRKIAELQLLESALRKSERKYQELVDLSPQIVFEIDSKGKFSFVNRTGLKALGYSAADLAEGIDWVDIVVPKERERFARNMSSVEKGKNLQATEYTLQRKDGTRFPVLMYCSAVTRRHMVVGARGVAVDITELRRAQERLWIKDSAIACSINAIIMADLTGKVTYVNPAFLDLWCYTSPKEVLSVTLGQLWAEEEKMRTVVSALQENGWWLGEVVARRKDGSSFCAQLSATMVTDKSGKPLCMMCSILDVTERKAAEEALRTSEERFQAVFESARDCIFLKDRSLRYVLVNPAMEKLLRLPAAEILGRKADDIFGPEAGKRIREVDLRALAGQSVEEERTKIVRGEALTFHDITVPLHNARGAITGICTISRNITERKKARPVTRVPVQNYPSPAMQETMEKALHAAESDGIALLCGESGSGKDYLARWIHQHSRRADGPFFAINCAAVPHELAESELFGHEAGAFTGARGRKRGLLELAEGGTLLLNEIGELPLPLQSKLLTFLDERSFLRVGGEKAIHVNARLMAATHRDLETEVSAGRFLPALYYRLNVFTVQVPPLRARTQDIPLLVEEMLGCLAKEMQLSEIPVIEPRTIVALKRYLWPGNLRELRNVLERALMLWDREDFKLTIPGLDKSRERREETKARPVDRGLREVTDEITRDLCAEALRLSRGNRREAARMLKISRNSLYRYLKRYDLWRESGTPA